MSIKNMLAVLEMKVGSSARKFVLLKLADNSNDKGECFPSYQNIADHCEMSKRSVINHINALCADGFIIKHERIRDYGNTSNLYTLTLPGSAKSAPPSETVAPPSAKSAPPPSAKSAPITCHSLEPVIEPKDIPDCINLESWAEFLQHRKDIKKPVSALAKTKLISTLSTMSKSDQCAAINKSIENRWTGIFAEKFNGKNQQPTKFRSAVDRVNAGNQARSDARKAALQSGRATIDEAGNFVESVHADIWP